MADHFYKSSKNVQTKKRIIVKKPSLKRWLFSYNKSISIKMERPRLPFYPVIKTHSLLLPKRTFLRLLCLHKNG